ncbi:MAG: ferritin family protein [Gammaproteobacteria bacterium]
MGRECSVWTGAGDGPRKVCSLLTLSLAFERAAAQRYDALAEQMAHFGNLEVSNLFAGLAEEERRHESIVARLLEEAGGAGEIKELPSAPPEVLSFEEEADAGGSLLMTPYRALRLASEAEKRAFRYFIEIAGHATDDALRDQAEALALEELDHLARIRRERRRAWRAERQGGGSLALPIRDIVTAKTLLARAYAIESEARAELAALANCLPQGTPAAACLAEEASRLDALLEELACKGASLTELGTGAGSTATAPLRNPPQSARDAVLTALSSAERAMDVYLAIAERSSREDTLELAQWLAECATNRLVRLSGIVRKREPWVAHFA